MKEKTVEAKIDALARVVASGFKQSQKNTDELARMVAQGFTDIHKDINRVEDRVENVEENYVTRDDLVQLRGDVDIMLDKHIGIFRKDYDELAVRVKDLEQVV